LIAFLLRFQRFRVDKAAGTYVLDQGYFGVPTKKQAGPLKDLEQVRFLLHEVEDTDSHAIRRYHHLYLRIKGEDEAL